MRKHHAVRGTKWPGLPARQALPPTDAGPLRVRVVDCGHQPGLQMNDVCQCSFYVCEDLVIDSGLIENLHQKENRVIRSHGLQLHLVHPVVLGFGSCVQCSVARSRREVAAGSGQKIQTQGFGLGFSICRSLTACSGSSPSDAMTSGDTPAPRNRHGNLESLWKLSVLVCVLTLGHARRGFWCVVGWK